MSAPLDPSKLKVLELRQELTARGLDSKGNKPDLIARLSAALSTNPTTPTNSTSQNQPEAVTQPPKQQTTTTLPAQPSATPAQAPPVTPQAPAQPSIEPKEVSVEQQEEPLSIIQLPEAERKKARAERFGIPVQQTDSDKKAHRAERFGLNKSNDKLTGLTDSDKLAARSKRFGVPAKEPQNNGKQVGHVSMNVTKAQRLGIPVKAPGAPSTDGDKLKARAARFGTQSAAPKSDDDEEKKRKRAERFAGTAGVGKRLRVDKPLEQQTNA